MNILVISLDNKEGTKRREKLNYNYVWVKGHTFETAPDWVKEKFTTRYNRKVVNTHAAIGVLSSHLKCFEIIIKNQMENIIICEDDALLKTEHLETLIQSGVDTCLLSGVLCHPTCWRKNREFTLNNIDLKTGINPINPSNFRWYGCASIYYKSWKEVKEIYDYMFNDNKLKNVDTYLCKNKLIKNLYYPSLFKIYPNISQTNGLKVKEIDNYKII